MIHDQEQSNYDPENNNLEEPSPEDFLPSPPKKRDFLQRRPDFASTTPALCLFLFFILASMASWSRVFDDRLWASGDLVFGKNEYWRLFSSLFVHADLMHLMDNSILFLIFGTFLYYFYGSVVFPLMSLLVGVITAGISCWVHEPKLHLVGASGMIYGMVAMWIVLYVRFHTVYTVPIRILRVVGFCLVILFPTSFHEEVDYLSHAIGFGVGVLAGVLMMPFGKKRERDFERSEG